MKKDVTRWYSERLEMEMPLVRWGHYGTPVLLFPTAGGDAEESERFHLIGALGGLIDDGRIKVYSIDSIAGRAWLERKPAEYCARLQNRFDSMRAPDNQTIVPGPILAASRPSFACTHGWSKSGVCLLLWPTAWVKPCGATLPARSHWALPEASPSSPSFC